jgi:radical SAM protein with 4Fe4S-binding SPASM domain
MADLRSVHYYFDERHWSLSDANATIYGPNIGIDGRNLTISFLSLNRAKLSIRLIDSIAAHLTDFAGEVLIGDNGSDPGELATLRAHLQSFPYRWRVLEFARNFGVAGGRNRIMAEARTDWVISVDNDTYFIANPLANIQRELATLGCHFMSFPILNPDETIFSWGGCLNTLIQNGRPRLTINPFLSHPGRETFDCSGETSGAFLCTFLFGGASILNRASFQRLGGFDDAMLLGFEDIDFSLRLFREGMKVGTSGARFLVHDHPKAQSAGDSTYEKLRFSRELLRRSAAHLEAKSGFRIWGDDVEHWVRRNEIKQGWIPAAEQSRAETRTPRCPEPRLPRIALITDTPDWAFANISHQLNRYLDDRFEFHIIPLSTLGDIEKSRWLARNRKGCFADGGGSALGMALMAVEEFDIVHVFWRESLTYIDTPLLADYANRVGMDYSEFRRRFIESKIISTGVYDHLYLEPRNILQRKTLFTEVISGYYVCSERLKRVYDNITHLPKPLAVLPDGVDLTHFKPTRLERFDELPNRAVCVGWVGNSDWASTVDDFKGVRTILKPALEELRKEGMAISEKFADRTQKLIPHREMPAYYATIDVLVCTSKIEGTPNPVLEAMACGVPVITTDVGVVPQVFGPKQKEYILRERSIGCVKEAIRRLIANPEQFRMLSRENLDSIQPWDWSKKVEGFARYFDQLLELRKLKSGETRTKFCLLPFSSPSIEPDGSIRLCSASSIFAHYDDTNMGNCRKDGLNRVWTGDRYRSIRRSLLLGKDLKPYCARCEYRFDAPAWMLQLHLALHAYHSGTRTGEILALIGRRLDRLDEYRSRAASLGVHPYPVPHALKTAALRAFAAQRHGQPAEQLAPEALVSSSSLPIYMDFNTLNRCNVSCTMCPPAIRIDKLKQKRDPYYRLTLDEFKRITDGVRIETAHFVGAYAEPLLNKEIFSLVAYAKTKGVFTAITTNATVLSRTFSEKLLNAGLDMLTISLHGATKDVAESIMLKSNFDRVLANIRDLQLLKKQRRSSKPEIYFNYVAQRRNVHDLPAFVDLAHDLGIKFINVVHLIDGDSAVDKADSLLEQREVLAAHIGEARAKAERKGIVLSISPAYEEVIAEFRSTTREDHPASAPAKR